MNPKYFSVLDIGIKTLPSVTVRHTQYLIVNIEWIDLEDLFWLPFGIPIGYEIKISLLVR